MFACKKKFYCSILASSDLDWQTGDDVFQGFEDKLLQSGPGLGSTSVCGVECASCPVVDHVTMRKLNESC